MAVLVTLALVAVAALLFAFLFVHKLSKRKEEATAATTIDKIEKQKTLIRAPGPKPWPIIGSLHLLGQHDSPFKAFTALSKIYGDVFNITLGAVPCIVVNNFSLIKEVLISKGSHFGGRPDFIRFHLLFGGDRNNSLALCDWSDLQKTRRSIARVYCSPRFASIHFDNLDSVGAAEITQFLGELKTQSSAQPGEPVHIKPLIQLACANMFSEYMCSTRFAYDDPGFRNIVRKFDEIFWEINQGYAVDFLPWLLPAYSSHMKKLSTWATEIRHFILTRIIEEHRRTMDVNGEPRDFTDALLMHLEDDLNLSWDHILFALEDFLGGHSAIGNLVMLVLAMGAKYPEVAAKIQREVDVVTGGERNVNLFDKAAMPYTDATILEVLRTSSSPIVPHVATQETSIAGYHVEKGTVVFINNYELNTGETYWTKPEEFMPERFISAEGKVTKPEHFIPFSTGKRTCIGQRLVQSFSFVLISSIYQHYHVTSKNPDEIKLYPACVALPPDTFGFVFTPRTAPKPTPTPPPTMTTMPATLSCSQ